jgi:hypothetical protein
MRGDYSAEKLKYPFSNSTSTIQDYYKMSTITNNFPAAGTFDWMKDRHSAQMVESAYRAVSSVEGWEFMKTYVPEAGKGFMFSTPPPRMQQINDKIYELYDGHSGSSYGWTMRQIEDIAKKGWEAWVTRVRSWQSEKGE